MRFALPLLFSMSVVAPGNTLFRTSCGIAVVSSVITAAPIEFAASAAAASVIAHSNNAIPRPRR